jgi:hypothetical protein
MDPNRLAGGNHSAEQLLILSAVILIAVSMLIVSHWLGTRRHSRATKPVEATAPQETESVFVGATPLPRGTPTVAATPVAVARAVPATAPDRA